MKLKLFEEFTGKEIATRIAYNDVINMETYHSIFYEILEDDITMNIKRAVFENKPESENGINQFLKNSGINGIDECMLSVQLYGFNKDKYEDRLYKIYSINDDFGDCFVVDKIDLFYDDEEQVSKAIRKIKAESCVKNVVYKFKSNSFTNGIRILILYKNSSAKLS
jgi:hypothetical protein